jgi:hypothetical protein
MIGGVEGCETATSNVPVTVASAAARFNKAPPDGRGRYFLRARGDWHEVYLSDKTKISAAKIEEIARKAGILESFETVMPE